MEFMTLGQMAHSLSLHIYSHKRVKGVSVDTRTLQPGEVYVALKGERVDGHDFLAEAQKRGALAAIISKHYHGPDFGLIPMRVEDPLSALQELARRVLMRRRVRIVAITGSIGKTTTKEFTKTLLSMKYKVAASPGNQNSQVGIPMAILNHTTGEEEILVLEMGMTTRGHLARLVQIAPPEVALVTTAALVHACNFDSLEEIARTKAEIFSHPHTCLGILSRDMINYQEISHVGACRKLSFSLSYLDADYYLDAKDQNRIDARLEGCRLHLGPIHVISRHYLHNLLASIVVARYFNVSWEVIIQGICLLKLPERRLQFVEHKGIIFLNDSYNASELSVIAALETLSACKAPGRKIAILGSMMELGKFSEGCHQRVGEFALRHVDEMYCLGEECHPIYQVWKEADRPVKLFFDRTKLVEFLKTALQPSDIVLLKGSLSKQLWKVLEEL